MFATIYLIYGPLLTLPTLANLLLRSDGEVSLVGSTVVLNCSSQTDFSSINITWRHNETILLDPVGVGNQTLDATSSALVLHDVQFDDSGTYSCSLIEGQTSAGIEGQTFAKIYINVFLPPEPATALKCFSSDYDHATCTWNRGGQHSNLLTEDIVERIRDGDLEWKVCTENSKGVSPRTSNCNQNTCNVVCYSQVMGATYRVSTNLLGANYRVLSEEVHFNIDDETIPNPPSDVKVQNKSASSLLITWTPDPGVNTVGKQLLVDYFVKYHWEGDQDWSEVKRKGDTKNAVLLIELRNPYGLYYIKVKCSSMSSTSEYGQYSRVVAGRTSEIAPVDAPGNFSCFSEILEGIGKRNIHLSWELLPNKYKRNGEIVDQIIRVRQMVNTSSPAVIWTVGPNETSYTLKDMKLDEKYEISIRVRNSMRESENYSLCSTLLIPTGDLSSVFITVACVISIFLFAAIFWMGFKFYKKVMTKFPDFQLPPHLGNSNLYFSARSPHRTLTREKEVYDELLSSKSLFVDLPPTDKEPPESPGVSPGPNSNLAFSGSFDIGNTPQQAVARLPLATVDELDIPFSSAALSDREAHRHRHWSSDTCTSSLNSPISVGSGGSYFVLRESDSTSYCILAKDGFSPVRENNLRDQELPSVGSSAVGLTLTCLELENDSDGEVSILGFESKKKSCKFGSPEGILYTRKHVLQNWSDTEVSQPRLLRNATDSPNKSRDTAGLFGLDEVTEEQEVESLVSIQEDEDNTKGKGVVENEVKEAGSDLGTPEKIQDASEDDAINMPPEKNQDASEDDVINMPPEKNQDASEDDVINIPPEKRQNTNEDNGIKVPSKNLQSSVDDVDKGGGALNEAFEENAALCHLDQPELILNYITVCKDDEEGNEEDLADVKTETGEDEISITTGSPSDTGPTECPSNHMYPGSSSGTYIHQAQLANISPISSPTRSIDPSNEIC